MAVDTIKKRKELALEMAQFLHDIYIETEVSAIIEDGQNDAQQTSNE